MKYSLAIRESTNNINIILKNNILILVNMTFTKRSHCWEQFLYMLCHKLLYKWTARSRVVNLKIITSQRTPVPYEIKLNLIDLEMRFELIRTILSLRLSDFLRNLTMHFRMFLYLVTCFLRLTMSLLCRSQARTISSPNTN